MHIQAKRRFGRQPSPRDFANGFTLIEVLVTVLILSIGLLGLAGLQIKGLQFNQSAYLRSQATILAYDIIDRMRANHTAAVDGDYVVALDAAPQGQTGCESATATCSEADFASFDLNQWKCSLGNWDTNSICTTLGIKGLLPDGDGEITQNGSIFAVTIRWADRDGEVIPISIRTEL